MNWFKALVLGLIVLAPRGAFADNAYLSGEETQWNSLFKELADKAPLKAEFTEKRYFYIRRDPIVLTGTLRLSPVHGLSLEYTSPERTLVIVDKTGIVLRDSKGRERLLSLGTPKTEALALLLPILRFDVENLRGRYRIAASGGHEAWSVALEPTDSVTEDLGTINVTGKGGAVSTIRFEPSSSERIEIGVGAPEHVADFSTKDLLLFFRRPAGSP